MLKETRLVVCDDEKQCNAEIARILEVCVCVPHARSHGTNEYDSTKLLLISDAQKEPETLAFGFDVEWVSSPKEHPIALVQLTSAHTTLLIRLRRRLPSATSASASTSTSTASATASASDEAVHVCSFPSALRALLQDSKQLKVGVGVAEDARRLHRDWGVALRGSVVCFICSAPRFCCAE
jgi:hypothetical protein